MGWVEEYRSWTPVLGDEDGPARTFDVIEDGVERHLGSRERHDAERRPTRQ